MSVKLADRRAYVTSKLQELEFHSITLIAYRPGPTNLDGYYKLQAIKHNYRIFNIRTSNSRLYSQIFVYTTA